ncbi:Uncharacterised protein [Burkholderia pseudomallei]|uniref:hypothetical protein n=1 Tax=Burkholderia pseudomallei TaxID=28450 RepID=UPI000F28AB8B|nr:hypothetical protein [Burkholderia pseudomallei]VCT41785.1 Uncharacterised protein [Burkholderia pseudomallei]VCT44873.1 Uncharacterised protein [Burkholderia pseudomallei]VCT49894.1 Uncharacterised protein [Burkholderia pseudomallei]VCT59404.1 Uncharacterised protein [Burkholderia pseudomallei]VCT71417.1 Uncharacterised protein [Burkholderia pseudomallei]
MATANSTPHQVPQIEERADALENPQPKTAQVLQLSDYRRAPRSDVPSTTSSDNAESEVFAKLARCDRYIYAGMERDQVHWGIAGFGNVHFNLLSYGGGVSDLDYDAAVNLRDAALRLLGRLQEIIDAGDRQ